LDTRHSRSGERKTAIVSSRIVFRAAKGNGLEIHVRVVSVDGLDSVDIRDFYPSEGGGEYGRGYFFPADPHVVVSVSEALLAALAATHA
jgi:hypothetical protein